MANITLKSTQYYYFRIDKKRGFLSVKYKKKQKRSYISNPWISYEIKIKTYHIIKAVITVG
jgi:hypothetical protein